MKPTAKLLQPVRAAAPATKKPVALSDAILDRKRELSLDVETIKKAPTALGKRIDDLIAEIRRDSVDRPAPIVKSVVVRVVGATCNDNTIVPLPNLRVTMMADDKTSIVGRTDVTGLVVFPLPAGERAVYQLVVATQDGTEVAKAEPSVNHTHLISVGEHKGVEPHAVLGRGWLAALANAEKKKTSIKDKAVAAIDEVANVNTTRLRAIDARIAIHLEKRKP
ncbi:MAG: hypothetical protein ACKV2T_00790 [Kofleriaceae bacterium]